MASLGLFRSLARHLESGALAELTLTTNGSQLANYAAELAATGVRRLNLSMDTLDPDKFRAITRWGDLAQVLRGVDAAQSAGVAVKINMVALKGVNEDEIPLMLEWAHGRGMDLTLIEVMPLGKVEAERVDQFLPFSLVETRLSERYALEPVAYATGGPARYLRVMETGGQLGLITPHTHNFCEGCNRVRVTCTGTLYMCLGQATRPICARPCAPRRRTICCTPPSMRRSRASQKAMISWSIGEASSRRWRAT